MTAYDEQIRSESNGWAVTAVLRRTRLKRDGTRAETVWTWSHGPYETKKAALSGSARLRRSLKRDAELGGDIEVVAVTARPLWKPDS